MYLDSTSRYNYWSPSIICAFEIWIACTALFGNQGPLADLVCNVSGRTDPSREVIQLGEISISDSPSRFFFITDAAIESVA